MPASDEPHKNGSRSAEEQRETSGQAWQKNICQQDKGLKEGWGHKNTHCPRPSLFFTFLVIWSRLRSPGESEKLKCKWSLIWENLSYNSWTIIWSPSSICYLKWSRLNRINLETMTHCFSCIWNCSSSNYSRTFRQEAPFKWTFTASWKHRVNLRPTSSTSASKPPLPEHSVQTECIYL